MNDAFNADKELLYITGKTVYIDGVPIRPITIEDIAEIGYTNYLTMLNFICSDINDFINPCCTSVL